MWERIYTLVKRCDEFPMFNVAKWEDLVSLGGSETTVPHVILSNYALKGFMMKKIYFF